MRFREATSAGLIESWKLNAGFQLAVTTNTSFSPSPEMSVGQTANKRPLQVVNSSPTAIVSAKKLKFINLDIDERIEMCKKGDSIVTCSVIFCCKRVAIQKSHVKV